MSKFAVYLKKHRGAVSGIALVLLVAAAWAQVSVGLYPLKVLQRGLQEVQQARATQGDQIGLPGACADEHDAGTGR